MNNIQDNRMEIKLKF